MSNDLALTTTNLLAAADRELLAGGYRRVPDTALTGWPHTSVRVYEDPYCIAAVAVYETWNDLTTEWVRLQESLVDLISRFWTRTDAKAWDGYLVLLTPANPTDSTDAEAIRYNTSRLRKLLASGEDLTLISDVGRVLAPLLPLETGSIAEHQTALQMVPELLAKQGIEEEATRKLIDAFDRQLPLVDALHKSRGRQGRT